MSREIKVPPLGESVTEAIIAKWLKSQGEFIQADEALVELETDKVTLEVNAPCAGVIEKILMPQGSKVEVGALLGLIAEGDVSTLPPVLALGAASMTPIPSPTLTPPLSASDKLSPAVGKLVAEHTLNPQDISGQGKEGRILKGDVLDHIQKTSQKNDLLTNNSQANAPLSVMQERLPMSRLRQRIAERLKDAQNTAALLTTFNEVDMTAIMAVRARYKDVFEKKHGVKLGFMSFFTKACILALKEIPAVNSEIDGTDIVYKYHYDIGVAVSAPQGLVVPVVKDADEMSFADIEKAIGSLGAKARDGKLSMAELTGGTFTITNGGIFGSLMSTPIINPPQAAILGMHKIQERPMVIAGSIEVRPMMYIALTYDHRIIDGKEAVTFLVRVKECIENPERLLLDI